MSHFTVLVTRTNKINVEEQLAPYDEKREVEPYKDKDGRTTTYNPKSKWDWYEIGGRWDGYFGQRKNVIKAKHIKKIEPTFAVVHDGQWYERGEMGWWAVVSNEKSPEAWEAQFEAIINSLEPDDEVTLVDCHI